MSNGPTTTTIPGKSLVAMTWSLFCALCLATLMAEGLLLGLAWQRGWLRSDRIQRAKESFYRIQRRRIRTELISSKTENGAVRLDQAMFERAMRISDLPVRANVSRRDSIESGVERNSLRIDQLRYEQTRIGFDRALDKDIQRLENSALEAVQSLLEQLPPRGAKEHLMLMLSAPGDNDPKQALDDVVSVMQRIAPDRRRKIFSEFQTPEEAAQVEAMLRRIREVESQPTGPPGAAGGAPP